MRKPLIKKKFKITLLVLLLVCIFSYIGACTILYSGNYRLSNYKDEVTKYFGIDGSIFDFSTWNEPHTSINQSYNHKLNKNIKDININYKSADIEIESTSSNDIEVNYSLSGRQSKVTEFKYSTIKFKETGDSLELSLPNDFSNIYNISITLLLPKSYTGNLNIKSSNGYVNLRDLTLSRLNLDLNYGDINLQTIKATDANLKASNGHIQSNDSNINNSDISVNYGDIYVQGFIGNSNIKSNNGNIGTNLSKLGKNTNISTKYGEITFNNIKNLDDYQILAKSNTNGIYHEDRSINDKSFSLGNGKNIVNLSNTNGDIILK
ncbi:DUF4097 domain-containing protein [Clostridium sardiniense]|uniref:DUF4097 domain-containing protein n=1 Tax=Clostridium sardiniense TaxID=29369 RepID=A0ABS7KSY9_CLOSR|nr:DUF4097 family beta strand repeat-containing protein [Clostridium sardiniense]MBY0753844.1 DUF4097 domain-containing protein [Clostridium sardiniense]MDQ0459642.1 DUF4097 and DUF4098 domain-containing protein YvlB [Clostridium sardiniense]